MKRGKNYRNSLEKIKEQDIYTVEEAIKGMKTFKFAKFDETVEIAFNLNVNPRHSDQMIRGSIKLPAGTGKKVKILVITTGEKINEAKECGADYVGNTEYIEKIQKEGWLDFDVLIATPDMMKDLGRLGKILGPKGLMPNPKSGTVTFELEKAINDFKGGKVNFKVDRYGNLHIPAGKISFDINSLSENINTIISEIKKMRPTSIKGRYIKNVNISTTMGKSFKLAI